MYLHSYLLLMWRRGGERRCAVWWRRGGERGYAAREHSLQEKAIIWRWTGRDGGRDKEGRGEEPPCSVERTHKMCVAIYSLVPRLILIPLFGMGRSLGTRLVHI